MKQVFVLLGGLWGPDGYVTSGGLVSFAKELERLKDTKVRIYTWDQYLQVDAAIKMVPPEDKVVVLGYSGGGSRATYLQARIDLMVLWDPSPAWQMEPLRPNVKRVISFFNRNPAMFGLGGGVVTADFDNTTTKIEVYPISIQHLLVQSNAMVQNLTWHFVASE